MTTVSKRGASISLSGVARVEPGELDIVCSHVAALHVLGIATVPLCRPWSNGTCSAPWHPQPCPDAGKRPLLKGFRLLAEAVPPLVELQNLFSKFFPCNLGIVVPRWMVVIEGDSEAGETEILGLGCGVTNATPTRERRPGRGRGWLFRVGPGLGHASGTHLGASKTIDFLSYGSIFVVPPSLHLSGHLPHWVPQRAPWEIEVAPLPPALAELVITGRTAKANRPSPMGDGEFTPGISARISFLIASRANLARLWNGEGKSRGDTSQSGFDYAFASALWAAKVPVREIAEALAVRPGVHRVDAKYCFRTAEAVASRRNP